MYCATCSNRHLPNSVLMYEGKKAWSSANFVPRTCFRVLVFAEETHDADTKFRIDTCVVLAQVMGPILLCSRVVNHEPGACCEISGEEVRSSEPWIQIDFRNLRCLVAAGCSGFIIIHHNQSLLTTMHECTNDSGLNTNNIYRCFCPTR